MIIWSIFNQGLSDLLPVGLHLVKPVLPVLLWRCAAGGVEAALDLDNLHLLGQLASQGLNQPLREAALQEKAQK